MKKSFFEFLDYRKLLKDWIATRPRGEMKLLAELLNIPAPVLSQILSGQRDLSEDHAYLICQHFGFSELEREYFMTLVRIDRSSHFTYKNHLKAALEKIRRDSQNLEKQIAFEKKLSEADQAEFYSSWLYSAIRLYCDLSPTMTVDRIATDFKIDREKVAKILQFLIKTDMTRQEGTFYHLGPSRTHIGLDSPFVSRHLTNWRIRAVERAQFVTDEEIQFSAPMTLSQEDFALLRGKIIEWIKEVSNTVKDSKSEVLACFNVDLIYVK